MNQTKPIIYTFYSIVFDIMIICIHICSMLPLIEQFFSAYHIFFMAIGIDC